MPATRIPTAPYNLPGLLYSNMETSVLDRIGRHIGADGALAKTASDEDFGSPGCGRYRHGSQQRIGHDRDAEGPPQEERP